MSRSTDNLLEVQKQVDFTYKNLLDNFDPAVKHLVGSGRILFKAFLSFNDASKVYIDALSKLASTGSNRTGETFKISETLLQICHVLKDVNLQHENLISFLGTQVMAPTEANLDQDSKYLEDQWKRFQRGQKTIEKQIQSNKKKGIPVETVNDEWLRLKNEGLTKATDEEKKRYLFVLERHVALISLYIKLHKQALNSYEQNFETWDNMCKSPLEVVQEIFRNIDQLPETPYGTQNLNNVIVHPEPLTNGHQYDDNFILRAVDKDQDSSLSESTRKSSREPTPVPATNHKDDDDLAREHREVKLLRFEPLPVPPIRTVADSRVGPDEVMEKEPKKVVLAEKQVQTINDVSVQTEAVKENQKLMNGEKENGVTEYAVPKPAPKAVPAPPPPPVQHHPVFVEPIAYVPIAKPVARNPIYADYSQQHLLTAVQRPVPIYANPSPVQQISPVTPRASTPIRQAPSSPPVIRPSILKKSSTTPTDHLVEATYPYNANSNNQLAMQEGDHISVILDGQYGWQFGENLNTKNRGWFPASFVKPSTYANMQNGNERNHVVVEPAHVPKQPQRTATPPPLLRQKQFEPPPQKHFIETSSKPKFVPKPIARKVHIEAPPTPVVEVVEEIDQSAVVVPDRPALHSTNYDTIPKNNPFNVHLRPILREDGEPKKYY